MPLLTIPSGSSGGPNVIVSPHTLQSISGTWSYVGNTGTQSLLQYTPTGSNAVMVLVYLNRLSGNPQIVVGSGSYFSNVITGTAEVTPYIPTVPNSNIHIPLGAVRLTTGTSTIGWDNIYDIRQYLQYVSTGTGGGSGGSSIDTIGFAGLYNGVPLGTGTFMNVRGGNVQFTKSGSMFDLFVTGSTHGHGVDQIGAFILDEGIPLGTGTWLNFAGENVSVSISGTTARIFVTGSVGASGGAGFQGLPVYDDSVFKATGTLVSFNKNLNVYSTGTSVFVEAPITTYFRVGQPTSLGGGFWKVPDNVYASGSLGVFLDGSVKTPVIDYYEQLWVSGTYRLYSTGTTQVVYYGVPCSPQTQPATGTAIDTSNWLTDSDGTLMVDSNGDQLTDSNG